MKRFPGRVGLQQRVLPGYRAVFFDALAEACEGGLSVFAGQPRASEAIHTTTDLQTAQYAAADNRHYFGGALYLCKQNGFIEWLEAWQPQALIVEANPRYINTPAAIRWMQARQRPVIGWGLGAPKLSGPMAAIRQRQRLNLLNSLDTVIAYSRSGAAEYRALGLPAEKVFVAPNAAARRPSAAPKARRSEFDTRPVVLFVGRLQARKRIDLLLQACAALPENLRPRLLIVGDGPARGELERLAEGVYPEAEFPGGKHGDELEDYFARADLFVLPGTGGLAIQQAMAHGLAVIVAEGDGTQSDLVRPGNGWLVPPGELAALSGALQTALSDAAQLRRMGEAAFHITRDEINIENMVEVFVAALKHVSGESIQAGVK